MTDGNEARRLRVVLVADDDAADLRQLLASSDAFQVVGLTPDWGNAAQLFQTYTPDIVLASPHTRAPTHADFPFLSLTHPIDLAVLPAQAQKRLEEFHSGTGPASLSGTRMRVLGGGNKGGVGKTTVLIEMATRFHQLGIKTLFVDISAACNIAVRLKLQDEVSYQPFPLEEADRHIMLHGSGVSVLALPHYFRLQGPQIDALMDGLQQLFPTIFIDGDHLRLYPYIPKVDQTLVVGSSASLQDNLALLKDPSLELRRASMVLNQLSLDELAGIEEVTDVEGYPLFGLPYQEELPVNMDMGLTFTSRRASVSTPWFKYLDRLAQYLVQGVRLEVIPPPIEVGPEPARAAAPEPEQAAEAPSFSFRAPGGVAEADRRIAERTEGISGEAGAGTAAAPAEPAAPSFSFHAPTAEPAVPAEAEAPPSFSFKAPEAAPAEPAAPSFSFRPAAETPAEAAAPPSFSFKAPEAAPAEPAAPSFSFRLAAETPVAEAAPSFSFKKPEIPAARADEEIVEAQTEEKAPQVFDLGDQQAVPSIAEMAQDKDLVAFAARAEQEAAQEPKEPEPPTFNLDEEFFPAGDAVDAGTAVAPAVPVPAPEPPPPPRIRLDEAPLEVVLKELTPIVVLSSADLLPPRADIVAQDEPQTAVEMLDALVDSLPRRNAVGLAGLATARAEGGEPEVPIPAVAGPVPGNGGQAAAGRRHNPAPRLPERPALSSLDVERPRHFNTFKVKIRSKATG